MRPDIVLLTVLKNKLEETSARNTSEYKVFKQKIAEEDAKGGIAGEDLFFKVAAEAKAESYILSRIETLDELILWMKDLLVDLESGREVTLDQPVGF